MAKAPDGTTEAPHTPDTILDQLLAGADPKSAFDADGLLDELKKALAERAVVTADLADLTVKPTTEAPQ